MPKLLLKSAEHGVTDRILSQTSVQNYVTLNVPLLTRDLTSNYEMEFISEQDL